MPETVRAAIWLYVCAVFLGLFVNGYLGPTNGSDPIGWVLVAKGAFLLLALPVLAFQGFLLFKISRGRNWARYALLVFAVLIVWRAWPTFRVAMTLGGASLLLRPLGPLVPLLGQLAAVGLLFTSGANGWFVTPREDSATDAGHERGAPHTPAAASERLRTQYSAIAFGGLLTIAVIAGVLLLSRLAGALLGGPHESSHLKPGDTDYPMETAHPTRSIPLIVTGRDVQDMRFEVEYISDESLCHFRVPMGGGDFAYTLRFPVPMTPTEDGARGSIVLDRFQAGHCGWRLNGLTWGMVDGPQNALAVQRDQGTEGASPTPTQEFWCYRVTSQQKPVHQCEELSLLRWPSGVRAVSSEFLAGFTHAQQSEYRPLRITSVTEAIQVQLHDLDAIPGALVPIGDHEAQAARARAARAAVEETPEYKADQCMHNENFRYVQSHQPLPDTATQIKVLADIKRECRKAYNLPPEESPR